MARTSHPLRNVCILIGFQAFGQFALFDLVWASGIHDARINAAIWYAWTAIQIGFSVPIGISLVRWGLSAFVSHEPREDRCAVVRPARTPATPRTRAIPA